MGMYSTWNTEDIVWKDKKGMKEFALQKIKEQELADDDDDDKGNSVGYWQDFLDFYKENKTWSFEAFTDRKIQGYWYASWCRFLIEVAIFIENGRVEFSYEEGQPFVLLFENGEVTCDYVPLDWKTYEYKGLIKDSKISKKEFQELEILKRL